MESFVKTLTALLFAVVALTGCSSAPEAKKHDPWNDADSQRDRAHQGQDEMRRDTSRY